MVQLSQIQKAHCLQVLTIFISGKGHKSVKCLKYKSAFLTFAYIKCQIT